MSFDSNFPTNKLLLKSNSRNASSTPPKRKKPRPLFYVRNQKLEECDLVSRAKADASAVDAIFFIAAKSKRV